MNQATVTCGTADPAAVATILSLLVQRAPAAATTQALEVVLASFSDRDWARLMAAIAPLPV